MTVALTIGEFSKMTYLSVKALRHYHDVGLLEPADIDPASGYRHYSADQVPTAQAIRRFRDLDMPIEQVRVVLQAPDLATRNRAILDHLEAMQEQLERTQHTVASLQALLTTPARAEADQLPHPRRHTGARDRGHRRVRRRHRLAGRRLRRAAQRPRRRRPVARRSRRRALRRRLLHRGQRRRRRLRARRRRPRRSRSGDHRSRPGARPGRRPGWRR